jgi:hypothetical protein
VAEIVSVVRDRYARLLYAKYAARIERARQHIAAAPTVLSARDRFKDAVASLPGVSNDPDTAAHIMLLADMLVQRKEQLDAQDVRMQKRSGW